MITIDIVLDVHNIFVLTGMRKVFGIHIALLFHINNII